MVHGQETESRLSVDFLPKQVRAESMAKGAG